MKLRRGKIKLNKRLPVYHIGRPILPIGDFPCEVLSGFRKFRRARSCCFWMKSDPSVRTWLEIMLDSRLARGQVTLSKEPPPKHIIQVQNDVSPFRKECRIWAGLSTGSKIYGITEAHHSVLRELRRDVSWLDGPDKNAKFGAHYAIAATLPVAGAIFMALYIYIKVLGALDKLALPRSIKWRAFSFYAAVIGISLIPVIGATPIATSKPSQRVLYMVEGYLSLRSAVRWHETTQPGLLAKELGHAMRGKSENGMKASPSDLATASALVHLILENKGLAVARRDQRKSVDLEKGQDM